MLEKFHVKNYRNLQLEKPIEFGASTFFYGNCDSGKSNLCYAITDINKSAETINWRNDEDISFDYIFSFTGIKLEIQYVRNNMGYIYQSKINCNGIGIELLFETKHVSEILKYVLINYHPQNDLILNTISQLLDYINKIQLYTDESFRKYGVLQKSDSITEEETFIQTTEYINNPMIVYDDIELWKNLLNTVEDVKSPAQRIYTSKKLPVIVSCVSETDYIYCLNDGQALSVKEISRKELKTIKQVCHFLKYI